MARITYWEGWFGRSDGGRKGWVGCFREGCVCVCVCACVFRGGVCEVGEGGVEV